MQTNKTKFSQGKLFYEYFNVAKWFHDLQVAQFILALGSGNKHNSLTHNKRQFVIISKNSSKKNIQAVYEHSQLKCAIK